MTKPDGMLRLTLDTCSVIDGAQAQPYGPQMAELWGLARDGRVRLWITEAFTVDQDARRRTSSSATGSGSASNRSSGPSRGRSGSATPSWAGLTSSSTTTKPSPSTPSCARSSCASDTQAANLQEDDAALMAKWRQKVTDVHHLTGHLMAGHDAFVTSDHDDMLKKRADLQARIGIVVVSPAEAVQMAHGQAA
jgi:hypothetical protein